MLEVTPVPAPCRTHSRAAFRRVAGVALPVRGRGGRRLAGDDSPHHGGLQRFQRLWVEEKINNIHPIDAVMVERRVVVEREQELRVVVAD